MDLFGVLTALVVVGVTAYLIYLAVTGRQKAAGTLDLSKLGYSEDGEDGKDAASLLDVYKYMLPKKETEAFATLYDEFCDWEAQAVPSGDAWAGEDAGGGGGGGGDTGGADSAARQEEATKWKKKLKAALVKRTMKILPVARQVHKDWQSTQKMLRNGCISNSYWDSVQEAKKTCEEQIEDIAERAKELEEGWNVFEMSAQMLQHEHGKAMEAERQRQLAKMVKEREAAQRHAASLLRDKQTREERIAEKKREAILAELMSDDGSGGSGSTGGSSASTTKRRSKGKKK